MDTLRSRPTPERRQSHRASGPLALPPSARRRRLWTLLITRPLAVGVTAAVVLIALPALAYTSANAYHGWARHHPPHRYPGDVIGQPGSSASAAPGASPTASASPSTAVAPDGALPAGGRPGGAGCTLTSNLVPTCGVLFGVAPGAFTDKAGPAALPGFEQASGRSATILHLYHKGDEMFPTAAEIAVANQPGHKRVLLINYKPDWGTTWAKVAAGAQDARIDKLAAYIKSHYTANFWMAVHHEPEDEVDNAAGSGMTAKDFAAMFRHTVQRLRADGVTNVRFTVIYMGYQGWAESELVQRPVARRRRGGLDRHRPVLLRQGQRGSATAR